MKSLLNRFYISFAIEKHSKNNRNLVPVKVPVRGKYGIYIATRYVNPNKNISNVKSTKRNSSKSVNKETNKKLKIDINTIKNQLIENYDKIYNDVAKDLKYLNEIGYNIVNKDEMIQFIDDYNSNIHRLNNFFEKFGLKESVYELLKEAKKEKLDKIANTILSLVFLTSGIKEIVPEWREKSLKEIFEDKELLNKIKVRVGLHISPNTSEPYIPYILSFNEDEVTLSRIVEIYNSNNSIRIKNEFLIANSQRTINSENIIMRQVAFAEYLKNKLNFDNYEISARAISSEQNGYIGAGVWLKRGYFINKYDLQHLYRKLSIDYGHVLDFTELKKLIDYMLENNITDATKNFEIYNKFLHFEFTLNSEKSKKGLLGILNEKEFIAESYINNEMRKNRYIKILNYIGTKIVNENKIGLFDLLKISDVGYKVSIKNKEVFLANLLASKVKLN